MLYSKLNMHMNFNSTWSLILANHVSSTSRTRQGIGEENGDEYPFLEEEEYQVHEKIFAWDQEVLYEAKVLQCKENDNKAHGHKYFVHYL